MAYDATRPAINDKLNISAGLIRANFEGLRKDGIVFAKPPYYGSGTPDDTFGEPGDRYFDTDTGDHYLKNVDEQWDIKLSMADANNGNHTSEQPTKFALSNGTGYYWKNAEGLVTVEIAGQVALAGGFDVGGAHINEWGYRTIAVLPSGFYSPEGYGKYTQATVYDQSGVYVGSGISMRITPGGQIDIVGNLSAGSYYVTGLISYYV